MLSVSTSWVERKTLLGRARDHHVVTDRPIGSGGLNKGCTSGELLLLAVGSCVAGNVARRAAELALPLQDLKVDVAVAESGDHLAYQPIEAVVEIRGDLSGNALAELREAAGSGRVTGRLRQGTEVHIRFVQVD